LRTGLLLARPVRTAGLLSLLVLASSGRAAELNDYPTEARADYVLGCMNVNGGTREALRRCSCSIDIIASILPYARYEQAETVLRMRQGGGYVAQEFRIPQASEMVRDLREAQAEAEVRCF
jgi:hypothetical protein